MEYTQQDVEAIAQFLVEEAARQHVLIARGSFRFHRHEDADGIMCYCPMFILTKYNGFEHPLQIAGFFGNKAFDGFVNGYDGTNFECVAYDSTFYALGVAVYTKLAHLVVQRNYNAPTAWVSTLLSMGMVVRNALP